MKRVRNLLAWLFLLLGLWAAGGSAVAGEMAGPRLALGPGRVLSGRFVYEHPVQGFDQPLRTEGRFSFSPGEKMVWAVEKPMATTTTVTPDGLVQSVGGFQLLKLSPKQMPFIAEVEAKLLSALRGDWRQLEADYIVTRRGSGEKWVLTLVPREAGGAPVPFRKIVAHGGAFVDSADIFLKNATDHVTFSGQTIAAAPSIKKPVN